LDYVMSRILGLGYHIAQVCEVCCCAQLMRPSVDNCGVQRRRGSRKARCRMRCRL
jgi:hypothetical protein